jgi:hypothetical protein
VRKYTSFALAGVLTLLAQAGTRAQNFVDYTGGSYNQNFDSLPFTTNVEVNTANTVTINGQVYTFSSAGHSTFDFAAPIDSSGVNAGSTGGLGLASTMSGWYGGAATLIRVGATAGGQTTGGDISFGASNGVNQANRALGLLATSTTGGTTFGLELVNDTGSSISAINLSFVGEMWRNGVAKTNAFGYAITSLTNGLPAAATALGAFSFTPNNTGSFAVDGTAAINQTNINLNAVAISNWGPDQALWLTWQIASSTGGGQGLAIDNLSFSAVPEPSTVALVGLGVLGMLSFRRRR